MQNHHRRALPNSPMNIQGDLGFEFSFAFQPIVDVSSREIVSFEALVRGPHGEPSASVFAQVPKRDSLKFDELCRSKAMLLANRLNNPKSLNLNLNAQNIYETELSIQATFQSSIESGISAENIILEIVESENLTEQRDLIKYLHLIHDYGFSTAIDDFGAGISGLKMLVEYQPHFIKLDRQMIGDIHQDLVKKRVFAGIRKICNLLSIEIVAEGVENAGEVRWLQEAGIHLFQGYYFARPAFEALPEVAEKVYCT